MRWKQAQKTMQAIIERRSMIAPELAADVAPFAAQLQHVKDLLQTIDTRARRGKGVSSQARALTSATKELREAEAGVVSHCQRLRDRLAAAGLGDKLDRVDEFIDHLHQNIGVVDAAATRIEEQARARKSVRRDLDTAIALLQPPRALAKSRLRRLQRSAGGESAVRTSAPQPLAAAQMSPAEAKLLAPGVVALASSPPAPEDLAESPEVHITQEIRDLAASLGNSPVRIYEHVRNNFEFEPYFGSLKGSQGALETGAGNDYDLASLLIALLRAAGIPARYARGTVDIPADRVKDWLGLTDAAAANSILNTAGIAATPLVDQTGAIAVYRVDRAWVRAFVPFGNYRGVPNATSGGAWVPLDPAFKTRTFQTGVTGIPGNVPFDEATYLSHVRPELTFEFYREQVRNYLLANMPGVTVPDIPYAGPVTAEDFGILPASLPYQLVAFGGEVATLPDALRHQIIVTIDDGVSFLLQDTLRLPEVLLSRRTVSWVPATPADQAIVDFYGGLANTPAFLVDIKPQLKVDGVVHAEGAAVPLGSGVALAVNFVAPEAGVVDTVVHNEVAGSYAALGLDGYHISNRLLLERAEKLIAANALVGTPQEDEDDLVGELLNIAGILYFLRNNEGTKVLTDIFRFRAVHDVGEGLTGANLDVLLLFDRPFAVTPGNQILDVQRNVVGLFSLDGDNSAATALRRLTGFNGSAEEHAMWEELIAVEAISTIKGLQLANQTGNPVHVITTANQDTVIACQAGGSGTVYQCMARAGCDTPSAAIAAIQNEVNAGKTVTAPECGITLNQWSGTVYISADPVTQAAAYIIFGGLGSVQKVGSATTAPVGLDPFVPLGDHEGQSATAGLPSEQIDSTNVDSVLARLVLPAALASRIRQLVAGGFLVTVSEVVLELHGHEVLVFRVQDPAAAQPRFFSFDLLAGGAGTEFPPGVLLFFGNSGDGTGTFFAGDPVNVVNGNLFLRTEDVHLKSLGMPTILERAYNSRLDLNGPFGVGWTHSFNISLSEHADGTVVLLDEHGGLLSFTPAGDGITFTAPTGVFSTLTRTATGFELREKKGLVKQFGSDGRLLALRDPNGNQITLAYNPDGTLATVHDTLGRDLTFSYNADGKIATITDFTGRVYSYSYDGNKLASFTTPSAADDPMTPWNEFTPAATTTYSYYTSPALDNNIKTITDPRGNVFNVSYYLNDQVFRHTDALGGQTTFEYDLLHNQTRVTDPRGETETMSYDTQGNLVALTTPDGITRTYGYANGLRVSETDGFGHEATAVYDTRGNPTMVTDSLGHPTLTTYEPTFNKPTDVQDPNGNHFTMTYDANGNTQTMQDPVGNETQLFYDDPTHPGLLTRTVDASGNTVTFRYTDPGLNLTEIQDGEGASTVMSYDERGNLASVQQPGRGVTQYRYDVLDRMIFKEDPLGERSVYAYDANNNLLSVGDPLGGVTTRTFDALNRLASSTDPVGHRTEWRYDPNGNLAAVTDPRGFAIEYTYDAMNRLIDEKRPNGAHLVSRYDANSNRISLADANGDTITYEYDARNRLVHMRAPAPFFYETTFTYDANGNRTATTDARGHRTEVVYDADNRPIQEARRGDDLDPLDDVVTTFGYDPAGNLATVTDNQGGMIQRTYDRARRLQSVETVGLSPSNRVELTYYPDGKAKTRRDAAGRVTAFTYDGKGRLTKEILKSDPLAPPEPILPGDVVTEYRYDATNNVTQVITAAGGTYDFSYDGAGHLLQSSAPLGAFKRYTYDELGHIVSAEDARGQLIRNTYDPDGNLITRVDSSGNVTQFAYDAMNRLIAADNRDSSLHWTYDALGRLSRADSAATPHQPASSIQYAHDANGNVTSMIDPSGTTVGFSYNALDRVVGITDPSAGAFTLQYDTLDRLRSLAYPNGTLQELTYDAASRVTSLRHSRGGTDFVTRSYTLAGDGNPLSVLQADGGAASTTTYAHDQFSRLLSASNPAVAPLTETFGYDVDGNITAKTGLTNLAYDAADRLLTEDGRTFSYDQNHHLVRVEQTVSGIAHVTEYTYDALERLTNITERANGVATSTVAYRYDALGRRIEKTVNGTVTRYVYSGENIVAEYDGANQLHATYLHGRGMDNPLVMHRDGQTFFYHKDNLGSVVALTDAGGNVAARYAYNAFGAVIASSGAVTNPFGYTGRETDPESTLYFYRARYYDPQLGRFMSPDPMGFNGGDNHFAYAANNPVAKIDPLGTIPGLIYLQGAGLGPELSYPILGSRYSLSFYDQTGFKGISTSEAFITYVNNSGKVVNGLRLDLGPVPPGRAFPPGTGQLILDGAGGAPGTTVTGDVWHWNQKGTLNDFGFVDHELATLNQVRLGQALEVGKGAGRVLLVVGVASDAYSLGTEINTSIETGNWSNTAQEGARIAAGWGGAYVGAETIGAGGAALGGAIGDGPGIIIGGFLGGLVGGAAGYFGASWAVTSFFN